MSKIEPLSLETLEALSKLIGDTGAGFTGSEIDRKLEESSIPNINAGDTKWRRLYEAFKQKQYQDGCSNNILAFIKRVMNPINYVKDLELFEERRQSLNVILSMNGFKVEPNGNLVRTEATQTLSEAQKKARNLYTKLQERNGYPEVLRFCKAELVADNYFHAVFEAVKSIAERIREKTSLDLDGYQLVEQAFSINNPFLAINTLQTQTERSEQLGFSNMLKGLFGMFRNTTAHRPKITWNIGEQDAMDILSLISLLHRKLDEVVIVPRKTP